ncbi:hypothetical protein CC80DRAFT_553206 [Byssothecium circinans]|uniref:MFS general substrate transporter n=1 Tax=Byssothecium circinans TaxID=147558 RepID=A0A6A5THE7_9PLEO|nr:hypothetical protein CC80DRAFT_553206 [Byssothecium circinans]
MTEKTFPHGVHIETISLSSPPSHDAEKRTHHDNAAVGANFELDENSLPPGYFRSEFLLGSMAESVLGAFLGVIGAIVCAKANNVNTLINGTTILGIAAAAQLSYFFVMGERVPMKYRLAGNAFCYLFCGPGSGFAPMISNAFISNRGWLIWEEDWTLKVAVRDRDHARAICFGSMATCRVDTKARAFSLVAVGVFFVGWTGRAAITIVTLVAKDQYALGTSAGVAGSIRFLISSIASTVYPVILSDRLTVTIAAQLPSAVVAAGLPTTSAAGFISAFSVGATAFEKVPGLTPEILAIGTNAYQHTNDDAYRTVSLSNIVFSAVAIVCSLLLPNVDHRLIGRVTATLREGRKVDSILASRGSMIRMKDI